ncbi:uncharacterized protein LOC121762182 isoform X2 [Salvia splendens]|uniref:uncharacterized protein LOC121762182 isoform X2 n=1 Tax=Salvia splendens TaxID=180675 RepID=UPI001C274BCF|nr:uncharacterized protein LOC121762182 isoform X2 [Salvia splendens]
MAEVNFRSWWEISQASEGLQLNSTVATWENILARLARLETQLVEHKRRVAATHSPLQPEPDPPDQPWLYTVAQPPHAPYTYTNSYPLLRSPYAGPQNLPLPPYKLDRHQLHHGHQPIAYQQPPLTAAAAANLPHQNYQPAISWCPLTSHHHSAAQLPAAVVPLYRGGPLEAVAVPDEAVVVEEVQDKSCSEVMLFSRKPYDGAEMLMVVPPSPPAISMPCSPNVNGQEGELFEDEPPLLAGIPPPCSPSQDYSNHTSVPIELVNSMEFEHLGEGNDRIEVNGENKDLDRVDEKESLILAEEKRRDERERVRSTDSIFEIEAKDALVHVVATCLVAHMEQLSNDAEIAPTQRPGTFDPGGDTSKLLLSSTLFVASWFPP